MKNENKFNLGMLEILNGKYGMCYMENKYESFNTRQEREKRIEELKKEYDKVEIKEEEGILLFITIEKYNVA